MRLQNPKYNDTNKPRGKRGWVKGRKRGPMSEHHREKIRKSRVLGRLIQHAEGELDPNKVKGPDAAMTATQVNAAIALVKKFLPDQVYKEVRQETTQKTPTKIIIQGVSPKDE